MIARLVSAEQIFAKSGQASPVNAEGTNGVSAQFSLLSTIDGAGVGQLNPVSAASPRLFQDFEGLWRRTKANQLRVNGVREIVNYLEFSEDISNSAWIKTRCTATTDTVTATETNANGFTVRSDPADANLGNKLIAHVEMKKGSEDFAQITIWDNSGNGARAWFNLETGAVGTSGEFGSGWSVTNKAMQYIGDGWYRCYLMVIAAGGSAVAQFYPSVIADNDFDCTNGDVGFIRKAMLEDSTGKANQNPSEYLSTNVLSDPWHGANVDGVAYSSNLNGNTVSSNVVTDAQGAAIDESIIKGYFGEGVAINRALHSRDFSNAVWAKTNITAAKNANGLRSVPGTASTLTATAGNATAFQTVTISSAAFNTSFWVKRKTGTGTVEITDNNGTNYTNITSLINSTTFTQVEINRTQANPVFGFRIVTDEDAIEVDFAGLVAATESTSPIETAGSAVTRAADTKAALNKVNFPSTQSAEIDLTMFFNGTLAAVEPILDLGSGKGIRFGTTAKTIQLYDGTNTVTLASAWSNVGDTIKLKWRLNADTLKMNLSSNGTAATEGTYDPITATEATLIDITLGASPKNLAVHVEDLSNDWLAI